ncbi:uncharacterized protein PG998_013799 [Apiospora kogelbergensis]|uniref:RRM domain-containing protein n=1 Tax=Apiospora kogelbergensis TaxID=1337665 RepID=A0AAW0R0C0_9PEZI
MAIGTSKSPSKSAPPVVDKDGYTRLHIVPLDPDLLGIVLSSSVRPLARNISYHSLEAFPERRYGFVEVPQAEAEKLKKKLNGATLRGCKMRVEQARPESIPPPTGIVAEEDAVKAKKSSKKDKKEKKKRKRGEPEVVDGVVLTDRKIKRGWTVSEGEMIKEKRKDKDSRSKSAKEKKDKKDKKEKRSVEKSKYTDAPECLFKQKMPEVPSAQPPVAADGEEDEPKRKKKRSNRETVVHEFERSTKYPSFLRAAVDETKKAEALAFEDGKGWVDAAGNVVEPLKVTKVPELPKPKKAVPEWPMPKKYETKPAAEQDDDTSSSGSSSDSEAEERTKPQKVVKKKVAKSEIPAQNEEDDTSSSDSSSDSDSSEDSDEEASPSKVRTPAKNLRVDTQGVSSPASGLKPDSSRPKSSSSITSLTIKIPPPTTPASAKTVHPLEALYKRNGDKVADAAADAQPFSFFNNDDDIEEDAEAGVPIQIPMTPYSKQDFEFRATRSAAPTPDTAHPSRSYLPWSTQEDDLAEEDEENEGEGDGDEGEDADGDMAMAGAAVDGDQSKTSAATDFQKFFWENRGDLNRKWKKRRKTALKERRNRENRARAARAI